MSSMLISMILPGLIRTVLAIAGGYLLKQGFIDGETWAQVSAAILAVVAGGWSVQSKVVPAKKIEVLDQVATTNPAVVSTAAVVKGIDPKVVGVTPVYPNNPPKG